MQDIVALEGPAGLWKGNRFVPTFVRGKCLPRVRCLSSACRRFREFPGLPRTWERVGCQVRLMDPRHERRVVVTGEHVAITSSRRCALFGRSCTRFQTPYPFPHFAMSQLHRVES